LDKTEASCGILISKPRINQKSKSRPRSLRDRILIFSNADGKNRGALRSFDFQTANKSKIKITALRSFARTDDIGRRCSTNKTCRDKARIPFLAFATIYNPVRNLMQ